MEQNEYGAPKGIRTPVFAVKGRRPRPLDDGRIRLTAYDSAKSTIRAV
jgi:integrase/recombinase XerD